MLPHIPIVKKTKKDKEPVTDEKPTSEGMYEMMKSLTLFTKDIERTRENAWYIHSYGPRNYWNNKKCPIDDNKRQVTRRNDVT